MLFHVQLWQVNQLNSDQLQIKNCQSTQHYIKSVEYIYHIDNKSQKKFALIVLNYVFASTDLPSPAVVYL